MAKAKKQKKKTVKPKKEKKAKPTVKKKTVKTRPKKKTVKAKPKKAAKAKAKLKKTERQKLKKVVKAKQKTKKSEATPKPKKKKVEEPPEDDPWYDVLAQAQAAIEDAVKKAGIRAKGVDFSSAIEEPPSAKMGDVACSIAFQLGKTLRQNPRQLAETLIEKVKKPEMFSKVALAGAYINFFLDRGKFAKYVLSGIDDDYGKGSEKKEKVMVEFSQVNTHKAFHIGHIRGTVLGETIARILENAGYEVVRADYQGDIGSHVAKWIWYYMKEHMGETPQGKEEAWLADIYASANRELKEHPEYEEEVSKTLQKLEEGKDEEIMKVWRETRQWSLDVYERIYRELDVRFDRYFFESEMEKPGKEIVQELIEKKIAKKSEGAIVIDMEKQGLGTYLLLKSDGTALYSTKDLALAEVKIKEYGIDISLYVIGSEQRLYLQQLFKTLEIMGFKQAKNCRHIAYDLIALQEGKMSSREGTAVLYSELHNKMVQKAMEEVIARNPEMDPYEQREIATKVAMGAMKYDIMKVNSNKTIFFDWDRALEFEGETAPYVQYAGVRCKRMLEKARRKPDLKNADYGKLKIDAEHGLVKMLAAFPGATRAAAVEYKQHLIANYAYSLAEKFNTFYTEAPVLSAEDKKVKEYRLALVGATYKTLKKALYLLGVEIPERM